MKPDEVKETRRQIATALAGPLKAQVRTRLIAIDTVLSGTPIDQAAAAAQVLPDTVRAWLRVISRDGVDATVARWQIDRRLWPGKLDVDPAPLRELAAKERNPRVRKRILALACVAEGMGVYDAEVKVGLNRSAITERVRRFREEGIGAFQDRQPFGRPTRLTAPQLQELRTHILDHPAISYAQLGDFVEARFGVRYSFPGLRLLLKSHLGIVWRRRQFREADEDTGKAPDEE